MQLALAKFLSSQWSGRKKTAESTSTHYAPAKECPHHLLVRQVNILIQHPRGKKNKNKTQEKLSLLHPIREELSVPYMGSEDLLGSTR